MPPPATAVIATPTMTAVRKNFGRFALSRRFFDMFATPFGLLLDQLAEWPPDSDRGTVQYLSPHPSWYAHHAAGPTPPRVESGFPTGQRCGCSAQLEAQLRHPVAHVGHVG